MGTETTVGHAFLDYRIEEPIGQGGMGVVYLASDVRLKRRVALKVMAPDLAEDERYRERFVRESELAMSLEHPNVVPIHDAGEADGRLYLVMRCVDGTDLRALLRSEGALEPSRALGIVRQVGQALDAAHMRGLVHRDVKPSNVLLDESEHVYLADFGLTRRQADEPGHPGEGRSLGTPAYLAPEQIEGGPIDGRADVYSLGCLLYECLTGEPPFPAVSRLEVAWAHLEEEPPTVTERNPALPEAIDPVIRRAMAKDSADRYGTCAELVASAEAALHPHRARRRLAAIIGVITAVLVGAVTAAVYLTTRDESSLGTARNPITIFTPWVQGDPEHRAFVDVLRAFEETTGLHTETVHAGDARIVPDYRPTLGFTSPGQLAEFVRDGTAEPLASLGLTDDVLERAFGRSWIEQGRVGGAVYGLPMGTTSKSLLWYRPQELRRLGLRPPRTWNELVAMTKRLARAGRRPWALGGSDSWTLTDWFENIYIRTEGQWKYDALFAGKLPFDDPSVIAALGRMTTVLNDEYLVEGVDGALAMSFLDAVDAVFGADRRADLLMEAGFVGSFALALKPAPVPGTTIAAAPFPAINRSFGNPVVAGAGVLVVFEDDPEVERLLLYLISPGAGRIWVSHGTFVSQNKLVPLSSYPNVLVRTAARQVTTAEVVRLDGSDLLPVSLAEDLGRTLQDVIRRPAAAPKLMHDFQQKATRAFSNEE